MKNILDVTGSIIFPNIIKRLSTVKFDFTNIKRLYYLYCSCNNPSRTYYLYIFSCLLFY